MSARTPCVVSQGRGVTAIPSSHQVIPGVLQYRCKGQVQLTNLFALKFFYVGKCFRFPVSPEDSGQQVFVVFTSRKNSVCDHLLTALLILCLVFPHVTLRNCCLGLVDN